MASTSPLSTPYPRESTFRGGYFFWMATLLLAVVLVGFAPTLYLRPLFDTAPIPGYLYLHGAVLTAWFVWLVVQTSLVATGRTATHRRLGVAGTVIAAAVVIAGPTATFSVVKRVRGAGLDWDTDMSTVGFLGVEGVPMIQFVSGVVWGNLLGIVTFALLVTAAVVLRRNTQAHKRLMMIASLTIIIPALARIARWPVFGGEDGPLIPLVGLGLLATVIVYDIVKTKRVHMATIGGVATNLAAFAISQFIAQTPFGQGVVRMME
jgi:hypothetical protein